MPSDEDEWVIADSAWWGRWFDRCAVRLRGGRAVGTGPLPPWSVPRGARVRHVEGTLLPGLRDAHVHSSLVDLRAVRAGGIAQVDDLGSVPALIAELVAADDPRLPRVRAVGAFLTAPGGYPSDRSWAPPGSFREVQSVIDAESAVGEQHQFGARAIKVVLHPEAGPTLPARVLEEIVSTAHDLDLPVIAHTEGDNTVRDAYEAGVDRLAHTPWTERIDDRLLTDVAQRMSWISTLDIHGYGADTVELRIAIDNLRRFFNRGGTTCYGTDLGNGPLPMGINPREVAALQTAGLTPDDVLTAMTDLDSPATPPCWVPNGLDRPPSRFASSLRTARVLDPTPTS
ncbi:amidohydrolase family protein [Saccharopolyspora spinosa]|uniref:Imidazolonepropionase-like amidohydrolase n=1 Tax=Saccharopolyspora spinosa TaxID=60894 RepID=A0A2N3Y2C6_SACSN|nr:amidohydrolase family protein [Saccharopolyspora spinosa]PKW17083.1 imidazolonepropionase-like amidohydrolase [Saccharopolyspora spinosa]